MEKPFRTVACTGTLEDLAEWLGDLLDDERAAALCAEVRASGMAWTFLGTERGPLELIVCDPPNALRALVMADAAVAVSPQPLSFAMVAGALNAPLCLPDDDEPLPVDAIWDTEVSPLQPDAPLTLRIEGLDRGDDVAPISGTVLTGSIGVGDTVTFPGVGAGQVVRIVAEGEPRQRAATGEVICIAITGIALDKDAVGGMLTASEATAYTTVHAEVEDGGGRLWWSEGWVRIRSEGGVVTLRSPRCIPPDTRAVVAREGRYHLCTVGPHNS